MTHLFDIFHCGTEYVEDTWFSKQQQERNIERYANRPQCFRENEYKTFFKKINSKGYKESLKKEAIQYGIKVGVGAHKSQGVFLLDKVEGKKLNKEYSFGRRCGKEKRSL